MASRQIAALCDQLIPELGFAPAVAQGRRVAELIETLSPQLREALQSRFGKAGVAELASLERENDAELFFSGLLDLAGRLAKQESRVSTSVGVYHRVEVASPIEDLVNSATGRRRISEGNGNFGAEVELFLQGLERQGGDYPSLMGMFAGSVVGAGLYGVVRFRTLACALHKPNFSPGEILLMHLKYRGVAWLVGSLGASLADRQLRHAMGQAVAGDVSSIARDTAVASLHLFAWRSSVFFSDLYSMRAVAQASPRNMRFKELEIFAFRQALAGTALGLAMLGNHKLFGQKLDPGIAAAGQLSSLFLGMNLGRLASRRAVSLGR